MGVPLNQLFRTTIIKAGPLQQRSTTTSLPQDVIRKNISANRDGGNLSGMEDTLEALSLGHQEDELSFITHEDLQPVESVLVISAPTDFRHLETGGQEPLMSSNGQREPTAPNFSRPQRSRPRSRSLSDLSPISEYGSRLSYYIKETLHNAPEPVPKDLSDTIMSATMNNNRLELILDGLDELGGKVQNKLDSYLDSFNDSSSSGSNQSSNNTSTGTGNTGLKRLLSLRKSQPPPPKPSPDPFILEDLHTRLSQIEDWGVQVQMARDVIKRQMADASERVENEARQAAKGAFIAKGRGRDSYLEILAGWTYDVDIQWIIAGAEDFIADFDSPRGSLRVGRGPGRARSRTMSVLSTWSDK